MSLLAEGDLAVYSGPALLAFWNVPLLMSLTLFIVM